MIRDKIVKQIFNINDNVLIKNSFPLRCVKITAIKIFESGFGYSDIKEPQYGYQTNCNNFSKDGYYLGDELIKIKDEEEGKAICDKLEVFRKEFRKKADIMEKELKEYTVGFGILYDKEKKNLLEELFNTQDPQEMYDEIKKRLKK